MEGTKIHRSQETLQSGDDYEDTNEGRRIFPNLNAVSADTVT